MIERQECDVVVVGGGAAGMAGALACHEQGLRVTVIEREESLGGILLQCIHNGFGLHHFGEELTGPEYALRFRQSVEESGIHVCCRTTAFRLEDKGSYRSVMTCSGEHGVREYRAKAVILSVGCRERNRGNIGIPGTRPAGVFTAGLAQRLTNIDGYIPGRRVVIVGSGDIGLIMARRMTWLGAKVLGVVEIMPTCSGLLRNVVQCLEDFDIPLYLGHVVTKIIGADRVRAVEVGPMRDGEVDTSAVFRLDCDTLLLSVGLVPEHDLAQDAQAEISPDTNGPIVDANWMTSVPGVFACGNGLHVHDLVDDVSHESRLCGLSVADFVRVGGFDNEQLTVNAGTNVKYVMPGKIASGRGCSLSFRSLIECEKATCTLRQGPNILVSKTLRFVRPAEMIRWDITTEKLKGACGEPVELSLGKATNDE